jgi:NitT/TauT family transport system substrate-binding protein
MPRFAWSFLTLFALLGACSRAPESTALAPLSVALNWFPEPEFGGLYQAQLDGLYTRQGLTVEIQPGGAGTPVIPMVATGRADFGVTAADDLVLARAAGAEVVAVFTAYQTFPLGIMVHASRGINALDELRGGRLAVENGAPWAAWLWQHFSFPGVTRVPHTGGIANFLVDPDYAQQGYVTVEPVLARRQGVKARMLMLADAGYNPYAAMIVTRSATVLTQPKQVQAFVTATRQGWERYLADGTRVNNYLHILNPTVDRETLQAAWEIQRPLIAGGDAARLGLGIMTAQRWRALVEQLRTAGLLKELIPRPEDLYTTRFLTSLPASDGKTADKLAP